MTISQLVLSASRLDLIEAGEQIGTASGFFYATASHLLLVTNRHVVRDEEKGVEPDSLRLRLHMDASDVRKNGHYVVPFYSTTGEPLWKQHHPSSKIDIALVPLDREELTETFVIKAFTSDSFLPETYVLDPGEDVFVMGYPRGFHDEKANLPVFRNAMIASVYGVHFRGMPCFLTDANLHPGTSGSPVITKPKNTWRDKDGAVHMVTGVPHYLLGVHSGTYGITLEDGTADPLGLGVAWYSNLIEDIASR